MSFPSIPDRYSTGLPELDRMLGGGLIPGTVCVVLGATGIGKSQLGIQFAATGEKQEGERGIFFDLTSRGDSQNHDDYAERLVNWKLTEFSPDQPWQIEDLWDPKRNRVDIAHLFARSGKRVTRQDLDENDYREWHADLTRKLDKTIRFFYGNFIHGVRRCVIDGVEPADSPSDSFQFDLFEYIHNQILRKEADWVARDLLRVHYRAHAEKVAEHSYPATQTSAMALCTSHEVMLDDLLARPLNSGDILSNANTIILMGKFRDGMKMGRALSI
ncbi:MAG: recombinase RecA, partial [Planctomycetaceae bacterium]|nr:recombinase RecA [Planctomycetaceae bacterium]